jgi:hypothetical protein
MQHTNFHQNGMQLELTTFSNLFYIFSMRASKLMFYFNLSIHFTKGHEQSVLQTARVHNSLVLYHKH